MQLYFNDFVSAAEFMFMRNYQIHPVPRFVNPLPFKCHAVRKHSVVKRGPYLWDVGFSFVMPVMSIYFHFSHQNTRHITIPDTLAFRCEYGSNSMGRELNAVLLGEISFCMPHLRNETCMCHSESETLLLTYSSQKYNSYVSRIDPQSKRTSNSTFSVFRSESKWRNHSAAKLLYIITLTFATVTNFRLDSRLYRLLAVCTAMANRTQHEI